MKKVKINLSDLLTVLQAMDENGTKEIIFTEYNSLPAIADADEPENLVTFEIFDPDSETKDGDSIH